MPKLIMLKGLPASGKTSWARTQIALADKNSIKRVNKDDLRSMIDNGQWSKGNEHGILAIRDYMVWWFLAEGKHVIVDDTNLDPKHEAALRLIVKDVRETGFPVDFEVKFFNVPMGECVERDKNRDNPVGYEVIRTMYERYLKPKGAQFEKREYDPALPFAIICDIDGTLAHNDGHRNWHEYDKVGDDTVHGHIKELVTSMCDQYIIIMVSGREDSCRKETEDWLNNNFVPWDKLYMRKTKDYRADAVIKREIFHQEIEANYNILFTIDDRNRVVDMWRKELLIPCLQVNYGDF